MFVRVSTQKFGPSGLAGTCLKRHLKCMAADGDNQRESGALAPVRREMALVPVSRAEANEARVRQGFWGKLRRVAGRIPFTQELVAAYYCAIDPETPTRVKAILFAGLAYFVMPADLIPDFIAGLGFTDDASVVTAVIAAVSGYIKKRHQDKARRALLKDEVPHAMPSEET